jgi:hypothetical protein
MKLEKDTKYEEMDLGFKVPPKGDYVWQFTEGIELHTNEEKGTKSIKIPLQVIEVIEGDEEAILGKATIWPSVESSYGERQILGLLTMTDLIDTAMKNFPGDFSPDDPKFIKFLALKLPSKLICARHTVKTSKGKNGQDMENVNFAKMWKHGKDLKAPVDAKKSGKGSTPDKDEFED